MKKEDVETQWEEGMVKLSPNHASTNLHLPPVHPQHWVDCCITHALHKMFKKYFIWEILMHIVEFHMILLIFTWKIDTYKNSDNGVKINILNE